MNYLHYIISLYYKLKPLTQVKGSRFSHNLVGKVDKNTAPTFWDWLGDNIWMIFLIVGLIVLFVVGAIIYERSSKDKSNRSYAIPLLILLVVVLTLIVIFS